MFEPVVAAAVEVDCFDDEALVDWNIRQFINIYKT